MVRTKKNNINIQGYIGHPNWTYPAGWTVYLHKNPNKTARKFQTLKQAKSYLKRNKVKYYRFKNWEGRTMTKKL